VTPGPVQGRINVAVTKGSDLRSGETVTVHVLKRLDTPAGASGTAGKWAVAVRGRVYPATTEVPLDPGAVLRARVTASQGKLVLTLSNVLPEQAQDAVRAALQAAGFAPGTDAEVIARALARSGLPLLPETIQAVTRLLKKAGVDARQGARAAATLVDKHFPLAGESARSLLPVLAFGQKGGEDPRRYRGRKPPGTPAEVQTFVSSLAALPGGTASALQAYNHARAGSQTWVVIPFVFGETGVSPNDRTAGTLKILYDTFRKRPVALSLVTDGIAFHLPLQGKVSLSIFCEEALRSPALRGLDTLKSKFHNMGLEVDDTINEGDGFDGFSPVEEGVTLSSVDTVG
jgi:hypothetical protein